MESTIEPTERRRPAEMSTIDSLRFLLTFERRPLESYLRAATRYGDTVRMRDFQGWSWLFIANPADVEHVLQRKHTVYRRGKLNEPFAKFLGEGLLTSEPEEWIIRRRALARHFGRENHARLFDVIESETTALVDDWQARSGGVIDVANDLERLTFRIVARGVCGVDWRRTPDVEAAVIEDLTSALRHVSHLSLRLLPVPGLLTRGTERRFDQAIARLDRAMAEAVTRERAHPNGDARSSLIGTLLEAGFDDGQIRDEMLTMLHAGHHTVASTLTFVLDAIASRPDVDERLLHELDTVGDDRDALVNSDQLPYLEMVIKESHRLRPPAWGGVREAAEHDRLAGCDIEPGMAIVYSQYVTHRLPDYWPRPTVFDPSRFEEASIRDRPDYAYFPFGGGPHRCIGQELAMAESMLVLGMLLRRFRFEPTRHRLRIEPLLDLVPRDGLRLKVLDRPHD